MSEASITGGAARPASVLVVDDTAENLHLLAAMLTAHGFEVRPVTSGRQALQAARSAAPDVILLDISMPEMDGVEVCRRLKADEALREIPVIFLTALADPSAKAEAFAVGGADYVTKPFRIDEVLARVAVHAKLRRSHLELGESLARLRALERLRDDLVQMVIHDMRTPLMAMIMLLRCVERDLGALDRGIGEDLTLAIQSASAVNRMANDVLDVSRLEEGKLPLELGTHDVTGICREVVARLAILDRSCRIDVDADTPLELRCDVAVVGRVVENLVSNAIKHTPAGGTVRVTAGRREGRGRVEVRDEGSGVAPEERRRIFEKFGALDARRAGAYHSAGLGLAFCKLAVEAHGGQLGVDPADPKGSIFWFELPAA